MAFRLVLCCTLLFLCHPCPNPSVPGNAQVFFKSHPRKSGQTNFGEGTVATYFCSEQYYELLGPQKATCQRDGSWSPSATPFCVVNVATKKPAFQSSRWNAALRGPALAVDGQLQTCIQTRRQRDPWWYVDLQGVFPVIVLKIDFGTYTNVPDSIATVRVGNNSKDLLLNPVCSIFQGVSKTGKSYTYVLCPSAMFGQYVSVQRQGLATLFICEVAIYSDVRLPGTSEPESTTEDVVTHSAEHDPGRTRLAITGVAVTVLVLSVVVCYTWRKSRRGFLLCCKTDDPVITREFIGETNLAFDYITERNLERGYQITWEEVARHGAAALATNTSAKTVRDASTMTWTPPAVSDISMGHI